MSDEAPDLAEEIVAWRLWTVVEVWDLERSVMAPRLHSLNGMVWRPGGWVRAVCDPDEDRDGVPHDDCKCGIYAARDREHLSAINYYAPAELQAGALGWRASKARPLALHLPYHLWERGVALRDAYDVSVELVNPWRL